MHSLQTMLLFTVEQALQLGMTLEPVGQIVPVTVATSINSRMAFFLEITIYNLNRKSAAEESRQITGSMPSLNPFFYLLIQDPHLVLHLILC
jgi:hypothetical protein